RKLLDIVDIFDTNVFEGGRVRIYPVRQVQARDLVNDLERILAGYGFSQTGSAIRFVAIDRLNAILAISSNPEVLTEVEKWIGRLQKGGETAGVRNYVYKVRNAKARDIYMVLSQLYSPNGAAAQPAAFQQPAFPPAAGLPAVGQTGVGGTVGG